MSYLNLELSTLEFFHESKDKNVIACVCDKSYLRHFITLLHSLNSSKNTLYVAVCFINIKKNIKLESRLKNIYPLLSFTYFHKDFEKRYEKKAFCCNFRVIFLRELLNYGIKRIIYMDVDSIVRGNISNLEDVFQDFDIMIHFRESKDIRFKVATGVIFIKNTENSKNFFLAWENAILSNINIWFSDQISFFKTYQEFKKILKFSMLEMIYIDWEFRSQSRIWAGKGPRKYKNLIYNLEKIVVRIRSKRLKSCIQFIQNFLRSHSY